MTLNDLKSDCVFTGADIAAFCDLVETLPAQRFDVARLRAAVRIVRRPSLGEREWRVTTANKSQVVLPIEGTL